MGTDRETEKELLKWGLALAFTGLILWVQSAGFEIWMKTQKARWEAYQRRAVQEEKVQDELRHLEFDVWLFERGAEIV
jgi:hypothetical protein